MASILSDFTVYRVELSEDEIDFICQLLEEHASVTFNDGDGADPVAMSIFNGLKQAYYSVENNK